MLCIGFVIAIFLSWIYDVTPAGVKKTKPVSDVKHSDQITSATSNGCKIATYISAIIIIALIAFNSISKRNTNADISKLEKSVAVLPFFNDSPDNDNASYINGIMSEILNNLSKLKDLSVRPRTSVEKYRNQERLSAPQIGKELNVSYIVEGRGQKYGNTLRLTVQLVDAAKDKQIWTESYEEELKDATDIFTIQSQVAQSIKSKQFAGHIAFSAYYDLACVYAFRGNKQKAYENLNVLRQLNIFPEWWPVLIKMDPLLENLRGEPEFQQIVDDIETKYQSEHERVRKWLEEQGML